MSDVVLYAHEVESQTLLGVHGKTFPYDHGNCFSVRAEDGNTYQIINFFVENLNFLIKNKMIEWPVKILTQSDRHAVIHDSRIPHNFYRDRICTVCAPLHLRNYTQQIEYARKIECGEIVDNGNGTLRITPARQHKYNKDGSIV